MENKLINIETLINNTEAVKNDVMRLLKISELEHNEMIFEQGLHYIEAYIRSSINESSNISISAREKIVSDYVKMLTYSKVYWAWFKHQWLLRDIAFVAMYGPLSASNDFVKMAYRKINSGKFLASEGNPSRVILERSYCEMIETLLIVEKKK